MKCCRIVNQTLLYAETTAVLAWGCQAGAPPNVSLGSLPSLIDPTAPSPSCQVVPPDSIHFEFRAPGPFKLCHNSLYLVIQDRNGQTVLYSRTFHSQPESMAVAARDSLAVLIAKAWGQPAICNNQRREWFRAGTSVDLGVELTNDVVSSDRLWRVTLDGSIGERACKRAA